MAKNVLKKLTFSNFQKNFHFHLQNIEYLENRSTDIDEILHGPSEEVALSKYHFDFFRKIRIGSKKIIENENFYFYRKKK